MGFELQPPSRLESASEFMDRMKLALEEAKAVLTKAKDQMAQYYNWRCLPTPTYHPGDLVYLDTSDIQTTQPSRKLSHCRLGPFAVDAQVSHNAYQLRLPFPMRCLHLVFNVVKFTPAPADPRHVTSLIKRNMTLKQVSVIIEAGTAEFKSLYRSGFTVLPNKDIDF